MQNVIKVACLVFVWLLQCPLYAQKVSSEANAALLLEDDLVITQADSLFSFQLVEEGLDTLAYVKDTEKRTIYTQAGEIMSSFLKLDSALYFFEKAVPLYTDHDPEKASLYMSISDVWTQKMMYSHASASLFKALEILEQQNDEAETARCLAMIGDALNRMEDYDAAIDYLKQAIEIQKKRNDTEALADTYRMISRVYIFVDSLDIGMELINLSITYYEQVGIESQNMYRAINAKGNLLKYQEQYDSAIYYYQRLLDYGIKTNNQVIQLVANGNLGHTYRLNEQYETALPHSLRAIKLSHETGDDRNLWENHMHASIIYEKLGDFEKSLQHNISYSEERERLFEESYNNLKSEYQIKYETQKKDQEIELQQAEIATNQRVQNLTNGILILLSLGLFALFWVYRNNRRKNALLEAKNQENELLLKEIHHRVKNNLERISSLLYLQAHTIEDPNALDAIRESQNRVESMSLIHKKLYIGKHLASIDMQDYLKTLGEHILDSFVQDDEKVKLYYDVDQLRLDVDSAIPLGLIINELLTNALKYAFPNNQEGEIQISLKQREGRLALQIADNGIGSIADETEQKPKGTGFGTQLIQLLSTQLGGQMERHIGEGTNVSFEFKNFKLA